MKEELSHLTLRNSRGNPANSDSLKRKNLVSSLRFWIYLMLNSSIWAFIRCNSSLLLAVRFNPFRSKSLTCHWLGKNQIWISYVSWKSILAYSATLHSLCSSHYFSRQILHPKREKSGLHFRQLLGSYQSLNKAVDFSIHPLSPYCKCFNDKIHIFTFADPLAWTT